LDFMKLLKSLEELLYELVSWLLFYPITMWRSVVSPLIMMRYADAELADRLSLPIRLGSPSHQKVLSPDAWSCAQVGSST